MITKTDLKENELFRYGIRLPPDVVRSKIQETWKKESERDSSFPSKATLDRFLATFDSFVDHNTMIGVHRAGYRLGVVFLDLDAVPFVDFYLIAKGRKPRGCDVPHEWTLHLGTGPALSLVIKYNGDDVAFQPQLPTKEEPQKLFRKRKPAPLEEKFSLDNPYGATISLDFSSREQRLKFSLDDTRLEELAFGLYYRLRPISSST